MEDPVADIAEEAAQPQAPVKRQGLISPELSILLIGGAALGLIALMCLTVFILIAVKS
ncbi:MAG: hypothetical protein ACJ789_12740 [Thermomicrobiales bacterium]